MSTAEEHRCEQCGVIGPQVMFDGGLRLWLCHWCWFRTPPGGVPPGR